MGIAEVGLVVAALWLLGVFRRSRGVAPDLSGVRESIRDLQGQIEAAHTELAQQRGQVAELAERLDFAERRLIQIRDARSLPPPADT
jgi:chromosome segregation ATPase